MFFSSISDQNSPNISGQYRATGNFLQIYFVTRSDYANEVRANSARYLLSKDALFFSFSAKYKYKNHQGTFLHNDFKFFLRVFSLGSVLDVAQKSRLLGNSVLYCIQTK